MINDSIPLETLRSSTLYPTDHPNKKAKMQIRKGQVNNPKCPTFIEFSSMNAHICLFSVLIVHCMYTAHMPCIKREMRAHEIPKSKKGKTNQETGEWKNRTRKKDSHWFHFPDCLHYVIVNDNFFHSFPHTHTLLISYTLSHSASLFDSFVLVHEFRCAESFSGEKGDKQIWEQRMITWDFYNALPLYLRYFKWYIFIRWMR